MDALSERQDRIITLIRCALITICTECKILKWKVISTWNILMSAGEGHAPAWSPSRLTEAQRDPDSRPQSLGTVPGMWFLVSGWNSPPGFRGHPLPCSTSTIHSWDHGLSDTMSVRKLSFISLPALSLCCAKRESKHNVELCWAVPDATDNRWQSCTCINILVSTRAPILISLLRDSKLCNVMWPQR